jgi:SAM-dependent methyltransferase
MTENFHDTAGHDAAGASLYATPREIRSLDECHFYHSMDVPGFGTVAGEWDLRGAVDQYLGHYDFAGKRVLDVGAATGMLTYHMERCGAEVISYDLSDDYDWDIVPFRVNDHQATRAERRNHLRHINNAFWLCHKAFESRAKMVNGVVYDIPDAIGPVDVAVFGSILLHLRDPFLALENGARLAREAIIVSDVSPYSRLASRFFKRPRFMPRADRPDWIVDGWYRLPPLLVKEYLAILGFADSKLSWGRYPYLGRMVPIYTIIARRTAG